MANYRNGRKIISITMTGDQYEKLKAYAVSNDVPVSVLGRTLLTRFIESETKELFTA